MEEADYRAFWLATGAATLLLFLLAAQHRMDRRSARMLLWALTAVTFVLNGALVFTFLRLLQMPLG